MREKRGHCPSGAASNEMAGSYITEEFACAALADLHKKTPRLYLADRICWPLREGNDQKMRALEVLARAGYWFRNLQGPLFTWYVRQLGVHAGGGVVFVGKPIVSRHEGSSIRIGPHCRIVSLSRYTALGVTRPTVLRTLTAAAVLELGAGVRVSGASICAARSVRIGSGTFLGSEVLVADTDFHGIEATEREHDGIPPSREGDAVKIGKAVFVGARAIILKGVEIGEGAVIGAGSVVTRSVPPFSIAAGNPCRVIGSVLPHVRPE